MGLFIKTPPKPGEENKEDSSKPVENKDNSKDLKKKQSFSLFSSKKEANSEEKPNYDESINSIIRRLKIVEEGNTSLRRRTMLLDHNLLIHSKKLNNELKLINSDISELKQTINKIEDKLLLVINQLKLLARKDDLNLLQKYVNMWDPLKYVSRKEAETIIREIIQEELIQSRENSQ